MIWWPKRRPLGEKGCEKRIRLTVFKPLRRCLSIRGQFQRLLARRRAAATTVEIERVTHIPADPKTGKHRQVVREG